jgi:hypothetical protein
LSFSWHQILRRDNARVIFAQGYGTSSVGYLPEKIISRKAAEAQKDGIFLCAPATLREKNHFTQSAKPRRRKGTVFFFAT